MVADANRVKKIIISALIVHDRRREINALLYSALQGFLL
jgi:hypothetical protein